jgi:hypothetical protein
MLATISAYVTTGVMRVGMSSRRGTTLFYLTLAGAVFRIAYFSGNGCLSAGRLCCGFEGLGLKMGVGRFATKFLPLTPYPLSHKGRGGKEVFAAEPAAETAETGFLKETRFLGFFRFRFVLRCLL